MATDLEKLVVQLSADIRGYEREMRRASGVTNREARAIENRFRQVNRNLDGVGRGIARSLITPLAGVAAALSVREVIRYADAWTVAGNKLAAASSIAGRQARSLEDINEIATRTRSGITETADLYTKLLRATARVAKSEEEVALATELVNKAFKAGGASASEQAAGILQLSQALGSGFLQGDELRSIRENATLVAQAIADEFGTTIEGLKDLGAAGELVTGRVFKAILNAQSLIEKAFSTTNQTIADSFTRINNAFTEYIGHTDDGLSATERLAEGLNALADNFDTTADIALKLAGVIAAALVGRAIGGMVASLGLASVALVRFISLARTAGVAASLGGLAASAGPIGAALTVAAAAAFYFSSGADEGAENADRLTEEMRRLGIISDKTAGFVVEVGDAVDDLADGARAQRLRDIADNIDRIRGRSGLFAGSALLGEDFDLTRLGDIRTAAIEAKTSLLNLFRPVERGVLDDIFELSDSLIDGRINSEEVIERLDELKLIDVSEGTRELIDALERAAELLAGNIELQRRFNEASRDAVRPSFRQAERGSLEQLERERARTGEFLDERAAKARRLDFERALDERTEQILKAAEDLGLVLSRAAARTQAELEIGAEQAARDVDSAISGFVDRVIGAESGGDRFAKNQDSSATGLGQFIKDTWIDLFTRHFPDRAKELSEAAILALRTDAEISKRLIEAYARENAVVLQRAGVTVTEAALHLSHFLGAGDAAKVLSAAPGTPLAGLISSKSIADNPTILGGGRTVDDAIAYAEARAAAEGYAKAIDGVTTAVERETQMNLLNAETMALATFERERAIKAMEIENDLKEQGVEITPELRATIDELATAYANSVVAIESQAAAMEGAEIQTQRLAEAQQALLAFQEEFSGAFQGALKGFITDLSHGKSLVDSLRDALSRLADRLLSLALDNLFGGLFGGFGRRGGLFHQGGVVGGFTPSRMVSPLAFAGAPRFHGGAMLGLRQNEVPAILEKGEIVIPRIMARQMVNGSGGGHSMAVTNNFIVPGGIDSPQSQNQLAAKSAAALQRAARTM